jgi:hypothetical protein
MSRVKYILIILLAIPVLLLISIVWWGFSQYLKDPITYVDHPIDDLVVLRDSLFETDYLPQQRKYHRMTLKNEKQGEIDCLISMPADKMDTELPVIIILGGLEVGQYTLKYIPDPGQNIIVTYQYPYHPEYWYEGSAFEELPIIRSSVLRVPSQVLSLINWIATEEWADSTRITVTGYSFGALFVPAIYRLAAENQIHLDYGVIAYGGVDIYQLLVTNMTNFSEPWRSSFSWLAALAIRGIEPASHAPYLQAEFLLINGTNDHQIPEESWRELHRLIPEPKTVIILEEGHMHPRKTDLTQRLVKISHQWLIQKGVANF